MKNKNIVRRGLAFFLALLLCVVSFGTVSVCANDTVTAITFADVVGIPGQEVVVPIVIENNTGIATFRFRVTYDTDALQFLSVEKGDAFAGGTLASDTNAEEQTITILWYSLTNVTQDGTVLNLKFRIADDFKGTSLFDVAYRETEILNQDRQMLECSVKNGSVTTAGAFYGNVTAYNKPLINANVSLLKNGVEHYNVTTNDGSFIIDYVMPGEYTVEVSAFEYYTKTYELTMGTDDAHQDFELILICDVDLDGKANARDAVKLIRYINGWNVKIYTQYSDLYADGKLNNKDYVLLMRYINGWDVELK